MVAADSPVDLARAALESALLKVNPRTVDGAVETSRIWSELGVLKRQSVAAAARAGKPGLLSRQAFQRQMADFQPGERKTYLGLATGHLILSVLRVKLALAIATIAVEWLAGALPAEGRGDRVVRAGARGSAQRFAYYGATLLLSTCIPNAPWCVLATRRARRVCAPRRARSLIAVRATPAPAGCRRALLAGALVADPEPSLMGLLPESPVPLAVRRRWVHTLIGSARELLRALRPVAQSAEVALVMLAWYTAFSG